MKVIRGDKLIEVIHFNSLTGEKKKTCFLHQVKEKREEKSALECDEEEADEERKKEESETVLPFTAKLAWHFFGPLAFYFLPLANCEMFPPSSS